MKKSKIIVPALGLLLLSTAASVSGTVAWFTANRTYNTTISSFGDLFSILMPFYWQRIVFTLLAVLIVSIFLSMAIGQTESHMRSGKLKFKEIF